MNIFKPKHSFILSLAISILLILNTLQLFSQKNNKPIKWYSFEKAVELNKKNPKKIFVDVYTDWCGWCKKMDKSTFSHPVIADYMNQYYYPVKLDAETNDTIDFMNKTFYNANPNSRRSSHQLALALLRGRMSYPAYVFMDENNKLITVVNGYMPPGKFEPIINFIAEDAYLKTKWEKYNSNFESKIKK